MIRLWEDPVQENVTRLNYSRSCLLKQCSSLPTHDWKSLQALFVHLDLWGWKQGQVTHIIRWATEFNVIISGLIVKYISHLECLFQDRVDRIVEWKLSSLNPSMVMGMIIFYLFVLLLELLPIHLRTGAFAEARDM